MADGHARDEWGRWSVLLALTANCHRDSKKGRAYRPADFDPTGRARDATDVIEIDRENIGLLRQAFTNRKGVQP